MMIHIDKAKELIEKNSTPIQESMLISVADSSGFVLAEEIYSPHDLPHFRQSSVDGYGIKMNEIHAQKKFRVVTTIKAGTHIEKNPQDNECVRIFTGAMVPDDVDMIIMQEHVIREEDKIILTKAPEQLTKNIRLQGSQVKKGSIGLEKNHIINPATIGFLHAMGLHHVKVYRKPRVSILITGDELLSPGEAYKMGKVYDSNSNALKAALEKEGIHIHTMENAKDSKTELYNVFIQLLHISDIVLVSGGISVGDYDYVSEILAQSEVSQIFHKVAQKPGKPLYFGRKNNKLVFGLPGNPASTLCCFYEYVIPALRIMMHKNPYHLKKIKLPTEDSFNKNHDLGVYLKAHVNKDQTSVKLLEGQESFILRSFALANALAYIPAETKEVKKNELLEVHLLPE